MNKNLDVNTLVLAKNKDIADEIRACFKNKKILALNLMSSPGSGKTQLLENTIRGSKLKIAVVEGDLETNKDAIRIKNAGAVAHQITTGQSCHLDAIMVKKAIEAMQLDDREIVFIENVGNLVCPASYDVGAHINVVLLSTPEGSDKVSKYPVMFRRADVLVISKIDLIEHFNFSVTEVEESLKALNPKAKIIFTSKDNAEEWIAFLESELAHVS